MPMSATRNSVRKHLRSIFIATSLLCVAASFWFPPEWIETVFSDGWFRLVQNCLVPLFGLFPFPVMGVFLLIAPILLVICAVRGWRRAQSRNEGVVWRVIVGSAHGLRLALYAYTVFLLTWGFGYRRVPLEQRWGIEDRAASLQEVDVLREQLSRLIHRDCVPDSERSRVRALRSIEEAQADLVAELEGYRPVWPSYVKSPPKGALMMIDVGGVVSPWTLEAHVESALPDPQWLATCAHELAHLAGYCGEAEANLVGFLSGLRAQDPFARYSTALRVFQYTESKAGEKAYRRAYLALPAQARLDMDLGREARKKYVVKTLKDVSSTVYDRYLKSQGMPSGLGDYSRGFRLFARAWAKGLVSLPR